MVLSSHRVEHAKHPLALFAVRTVLPARPVALAVHRDGRVERLVVGRGAPYEHLEHTSDTGYLTQGGGCRGRYAETIIGRRERAESVPDDVAYPSVELVLDLHEQIVEEGDHTEPGVRSEDAIESALQYVSEGYFGEVPRALHEKAVHLMRLLVADHPFVDGNKRTALRTVVVFYMLNGYTFQYGDEIRALLHRFATDEAEVDIETAVVYFRACSRRN